VTQIVVQVLEAIQVDQQHRQGFSRIVPGKRLLQLAQKHAAIAEAGKRVQQPVLPLGVRS
jgi:hypothetical protein